MRRMLLALALALVFPLYALAANITATWDYPVSEEANIQGYRLYYGKVSQSGVTDPVDLVSAAPYEQRIEIANPAARSHAFVINDTGTYYFRMTAYGLVDGVADDSVFSEPEVSAVLGLGSLSNVSVTITFTVP